MVVVGVAGGPIRTERQSIPEEPVNVSCDACSTTESPFRCTRRSLPKRGNDMKRIFAIFLYCAAILALGSNLAAFAQETKAPSLKYVMTVQADLAPAQPAAENLLIVHVTGGWVKAAGGGTGTIVQPCGDWVSILPGGTAKLDIRCSFKMDDDSIILVEATGRIKWTEAGGAKMQKGELVTANDAYFIENPTMRTRSKKYAWVNDAVFVEKMVEWGPKGSYVRFDAYMVVP